MSKDIYPRLVFPYGFDKRDNFEAPERGFYGPAVVEMSGDKKYAVTFYDPARLAQELEILCVAGTAWLAEPGLIVLQEVTEDNMRAAVKQLAEDGFFDYLSPLDEVHFRTLFPLLNKGVL